MGRRPRIPLAGGIYHVCNRGPRGEHVFRDEGEADRFEALLAATKKRDDFQVPSWCVMSNRYHLAVRIAPADWNGRVERYLVAAADEAQSLPRSGA